MSSTKDFSNSLVPGLYDQPLTVGIARELSALPDSMRAEVERLDPHEAPEAIARQLHRRLADAFGSFGGSREERLAAQVALANRVRSHVTLPPPSQESLPISQVGCAPLQDPKLRV